MPTIPVQAVFKTSKASLRDIPFSIQVSDWTESNGIYTAVFQTAYVTSTCKAVVTYDSSFRNFAVGDIESVKGNGSMTFTTGAIPTGTISGNIYAFDNDDGKVPVLIEDTVVPIANGGTGASSAAGARTNLGMPEPVDFLSDITPANNLLSITSGICFKIGRIVIVNLRCSNISGGSISGGTKLLSGFPEPAQSDYSVNTVFFYGSNGTTPYIRNDGDLYISSSSAAIAQNANFSFSFTYICKEDE